ncbi:hypothetical protein ADUPG1_013306 [Aduncisulcus paluster]|uniref:Uncharacterized protein n=1 Tax=Aduncisulcus paluster TaxID=2918883 RepID=A0ABQ5K4H4_9EUKA|nr:hypothetical protein ADUPG1_013306 [Aduncisulcus paluster]
MDTCIPNIIIPSTIIGFIFLLAGTVVLIVAKPVTNSFFDNVDSFMASIEDVSSSSSFSRFKNSLATMSMTLNFNGTTFSLDINDFTAYSDEPCGVDEDDMAALEERGISSSDMDSFFYRYSPLTSSDISSVSGLDFYADIELFEDSTSNLSISKEFVNSDLTDTDQDFECQDYERACSSGIFRSSKCLSVSYAKALNIGITPTYPNTYDVNDDDVTFANWYYYSDESFSCSSVDYLPVSSLSLNIYDITTYCGVYQANYGGDLGKDWSNFITIGIILFIIGGCCGGIVIISGLISCCDVESGCSSSCSSIFYSCKTSHERKKTQREEERKKREEERKKRAEVGSQRIDLEDRSHSPLNQPSSQPIQPLPDEVVAQGDQDESGQTFIPVSVVLARMQAGEII